MESTHYNDNVTSDINLATTGWDAVEATEDTFMEEVKTYTEFKVANFINMYWYPILVPIGLVGNSLSFAVMMKPNNRKMSTCIYMAAISINDNLMMYVCLHVFLVSALQIHTWHHFECKFVIFCSLVALQGSTYLILAMTVDKYIAIKWPYKAATYSTPKRATLIVVVLQICIIIYNVPHLFLSSTVGDNKCVAYSNSSVISRVHSWFSFVLNSVIPFTLLIHMNYVIVKTVRNSRKMFTGNITNHGMEARQKTTENQLTIMLLLVTTLFLILLGPTYFRFIYVAFVKRDTPLEFAKSMLVFQITAKLYKTNSGINFLLYCISGQKFRNDLKEILCCFNIFNSSVTNKKDPSQSNGTENTSVETKTSRSIPLSFTAWKKCATNSVDRPKFFSICFEAFSFIRTNH